MNKFANTFDIWLFEWWYNFILKVEKLTNSKLLPIISINILLSSKKIVNVFGNEFLFMMIVFKGTPLLISNDIN